MSLNPKGTIPTLVIQDTEDGNEKKVLTESRDILDYAVSKRPELNGGDREEADAFIEKCYTGSLNYLYIVGVSSHLLQRNAMLAKWKSRYEDAKNKMEATGENAELKKAYEEKARVNKEKVDTFPGLGPPWGEEKGEEVVGELEKILGDKKYLGGDEFTWGFRNSRTDVLEQRLTLSENLQENGCLRRCCPFLLLQYLGF